MSSEKEKAPQAEKKSKVARASSQAARPVVAAIEPLDEDKLDAPSRQTMIMLSVICLSTLILWGAGRAACNYRVPGESLTPRKVSLEDRTRTPKDVGLEFAQALSGGDFKIAEQLATGDALAQVKKDESSCGACEARKKVRSELKSVSVVLQANSVDSFVKVRTIGGVEGEQERLFGIAREERNWRVTRFLDSVEGASLKEPPVRNDAPASLRRADGAEGTEQEGALNQPGNPDATDSEPEEIAPQEAPEE